MYKKIGTNTITTQYDLLSDFQRSVYWIHRLQKFPFILKLENIYIDTHTIIFRMPQHMEVHTEGLMWQKLYAMQTLNRLGIFMHPKRRLYDNSFHQCQLSNRIFLHDLSGFVTHNIAAPYYVLAPKSMTLVPRYPGLTLFQNIQSSIGIFVQVGAYNTAFQHIMKYLCLLCSTLKDKKVTVVCSILETLSCQHTRKIKDAMQTLLLDDVNQLHILSVPNRGMDIGAFLESVLYCNSHGLTFEYICKLHTKSNATWRETLCEPIVGRNRRIQNICRIFSSVPSVGCCASKTWTLEVCQDIHNHDIVSQYCSIMQIDNPYHIPKAEQKGDSYYFVGGTIFWLRYSIVEKLLREHHDLVKEAVQNFKEGYISNNVSTHTHSWERLLGILVHESHMKFVGF